MLSSNLTRVFRILVQKLWRCDDSPVSVTFTIDKGGVVVESCIDPQNNIESLSCMSGSSGANNPL